MDLEKVKAFLTVASSGSVTQAAKLLYISQSTLSYRIQALENELDCPLFLRKQGRITQELTPAGRNFYHAASKLLSAYEEIARIPLVNANSTLAIGAVDSLNTVVLNGFYPRILSAMPGLNLEIGTMSYKEIYDRIKCLDMQLGFVSKIIQTKNVEIIPLFKEKMYLLHREADSLYAQVNNPKELRAEHGIFLSWSDDFCTWYENWFSPQHRGHILLNRHSMAYDMISQYDYWLIAPASVAMSLKARGGVCCRELEEAPHDRITYLLQSRQTSRQTEQTCAQVYALLQAYLRENEENFSLQLLS